MMNERTNERGNEHTNEGVNEVGKGRKKNRTNLIISLMLPTRAQAMY